MPRRRPFIPASVVAIAAVSLLAAGCGSSNSSASSDASSSGSPQTQAQIQTENQELIRFTDCMRSHGVPSLPDPTGDPHAFKEALDPTTEQSPAFGFGDDGLPAPAAGPWPAQPAHAAQSGADRRAAGVRPMPARPRVPEIPRPEQHRRHNPRDAFQRWDRPPTARGCAGGRRVYQRHPRAPDQGRRRALRRGTLERTLATFSRAPPPIAAGNATSIASPPSGLACASRSAPCALAIA